MECRDLIEELGNKDARSERDRERERERETSGRDASVEIIMRQSVKRKICTESVDRA
jgi:hypothetical protein